MQTPTMLTPPEPRQPEALPPAKSEPTLYPELDLDQHGPSKNYWWVWALIFGLIGFGCYKLYQFEENKKASISAKKGMMRPRSIPVVAATAHSGDMPVYLQGLGTVTAFNTVTVKPRVDGQLVSVNYHEGQNVNQGDLLATLDSRPFQVALDQANGSLAQARGNVAKDQASLRDAQANYARDEELFKANIIAKQQLDTQLATADQIRGAIEADNAMVQAAQATVANAKLNLTYTRITAPLTGRIGLRVVDSGNIVHASDAAGIAVITQLHPISVLFSIPEDRLPSVLEKLRQGKKLRAEAYDRDQTKKIAEGTLLTVDNQIDTTTGTSRFKAVFSNADNTLFPNQFVNIRLWLDTKLNAVIVPAVAIQRGPSGAFVYLVGEDSKVAIRAVKVGLSEGNDVAIDDGLKAGDRVVVDGAEKLIEGMSVTMRQAGQGNGAAGGGPNPRGKGPKGNRGPNE